MSKKEKIRLDAVLVGVIASTAFQAKLPNGHEITAYIAKENKADWDGSLEPGDKVKVELSPFDMSKGTIVPANEV